KAPTGATYRHSIHRNEPNRPHISSDIQNVKEPHPRSKTNRSANLVQRARPFLLSDAAVSPACRPQRLSAAGEGAFRHMAGGLQAKKSRAERFFAESRSIKHFQLVTQA
ncbi:hypothetical protein, partial [Cribrihabitans marinus]|uniref:hypothetical protein n=1 Tax=Cribrihabitans marinus TaxID=1227549 RepID=UPI001C4329B1